MVRELRRLPRALPRWFQSDYTVEGRTWRRRLRPVRRDRDDPDETCAWNSRPLFDLRMDRAGKLDRVRCAVTARIFSVEGDWMTARCLCRDSRPRRSGGAKLRGQGLQRRYGSSAALLRFSFVGLILFVAASAFGQTPAFDLVITNGHIVDGTGSPWYSGDIGIRDGK